MVVEYEGKKLAFVHIGGNAGTSIEWYLYRLPYNYDKPELERTTEDEFTYIDTIRDQGFTDWIDNQHETAQQMYDRIGEALYFTVIRNPYKRMVSKFFTSPYTAYLSEVNIKGLFQSFLTDIYNGNTVYGKSQALHVRPQLDMITYNGSIVENVLRFENLQQGFEGFCKANGLPVRELIKCNSTSHPLKSMDIYTDKAQKMVYNREQELIERYGYHI